MKIKLFERSYLFSCRVLIMSIVALPMTTPMVIMMKCPEKDVFPKKKNRVVRENVKKKELRSLGNFAFDLHAICVLCKLISKYLHIWHTFTRTPCIRNN